MGSGGIFGIGGSDSTATQSQQTAGDGAKQVRGNNSNVTESGALTIGTRGTLVAPGSVSLTGSSKLNTGNELAGSSKLFAGGSDLSGIKGNVTLTTTNNTPPGLFDFLTGQTNSLTDAIKVFAAGPPAGVPTSAPPPIVDFGGGSSGGFDPNSLADAPAANQPNAAAQPAGSGSLGLWIVLGLLGLAALFFFWKRKK